MDSDNINNKELEQTNRGSNAIIKRIALVILFLIPLIYLFIKSSEKKDVEPVSTAVPAVPQTDIASLEKNVETNPTFDNLISLSLAYINNNMPSKSIPYLNKAIELNPNSSVAYNNMGVAYILMKQYDDGIAACNRALQIDPKFQLAKNNLAWGMDEKNKAAASIKK